MAPFNVGDKARIKMSMSSTGKYSRFLGEAVEITGLSWGIYTVQVRATGYIIHDVSPKTLTVYQEISHLHTLEQEREKLMKQVAHVDMKISYMKESGADVFDYTEFKIFNAIQESSNEGLSSIEQAKRIAEAVRKKK